MKKEEVLIEALPYIQTYEGKTFVIKYGGAAMTDPLLKETFGKDVTILRKIGINIVIVHGGGKEITDIAKKLGIETKFVDGQRYTDEKMVEVVQMVLAGKINKERAFGWEKSSSMHAYSLWKDLDSRACSFEGNN